MSSKKDYEEKVNKPEYKLKRLYEYKIEIQEFETKLDKNKKQWKELGKAVRSDGQKLSEMKKTLFEMI